MAYQYRYITVNGEPPNGEFAPGHPTAPGAASGPGYPPPPPPYTRAPSYNRAVPVPRPSVTPPPSPPAGDDHDPNDPYYPPGARFNGVGIRFRSGAGYIFPELNCLIHVIDKGGKPWRRPGVQFKYKAFWVSIRIKIDELIRQLGVRQGARAEAPNRDFGIVEVHERGDGRWRRGTEYRLGAERTAQTLEDAGWTEHRGQPDTPIWLAMLTP